MDVINPFNDIPDKDIQSSSDFYGQDLLDNVAAIKIGSGVKAFKADESGIWLGANKFADAPFSVDMSGAMKASSATITGYATDSELSDVAGDLTDLEGNALVKDSITQILAGKIIVGDSKITIDGVNKRIIINDGTYDRILIGYQSGGF